jgi:hypothetical protein
MSGVLFTDNKVVLAGYHPKKKQISGIGGKARPGESSHDTAMREMLEELFGYTDTTLLKDIQLTPQQMLLTDGYIVYVYSFHDLEIMLDILCKHPSPYYAVFPKTCSDLVFNRRAPPDAEITHLCILPCESQIIAPELLSDIRSTWS